MHIQRYSAIAYYSVLVCLFIQCFLSAICWLCISRGNLQLHNKCWCFFLSVLSSLFVMHIQRNSALQIPHINIFVSAIMSKSKPFQLFAAEVEGVGVCVCVYALDCVCVLCVYKRLCFVFVYIKVCVCASVG